MKVTKPTVISVELTNEEIKKIEEVRKIIFELCCIMTDNNCNQANWTCVNTCDWIGFDELAKTSDCLDCLQKIKSIN